MKTTCFVMLAVASFGLSVSAWADSGKACDVQSLQRASKVFATCAACHSTDPSGKSGIAPNLRGVVGRGIGKAHGFPYSSELASEKGVWTAEKLDKFLASPATMYPKTQMAFAGLKKQEDRDAVICYLEQTK